jgi:site-specific DNA-methyltransferase (adenine-specific)
MKEKAGRNRTLTLNSQERETHRRKLLYKENLEKEPFSNILDKTINCDLLEALDHLPSEFADLIIIDPPYNLSKDFHGVRFNSRSQNEYLDYLRSWFPRVVRLLKEDGSLYLCGDWKSTSALQTVMEENLTVLNRITWQREKGRGAKANWKNGMEDIWFGVKDPKKYHFDVDAVKVKRKVVAPYREKGVPKDWDETPEGNFRLTHPSNFWDDITIPYWSMPENTDHPTQKPEKLVAKLILASSKKGDVIFDPFLGSGTTSVVAKKLGRHFLGIELNEEYAIWAETRLERALIDNTIQGYHQGLFWERNSLNAQKIGKNKVQDLQSKLKL